MQTFVAIADTLALTLEQEQLLSARYALWEEQEGEEQWGRFRQRERDKETLALIAELLGGSGFAEGTPLTAEQMMLFLSFVRAFAPNPNLDRRLIQTPNLLNRLNQDLAHLLYAQEPLPAKLSKFLQRGRMGKLTTSQILCAVFPERFPLISASPLALLNLTLEQRHEARKTIEATYPDTDFRTLHGSTLVMLTEAAALKTVGGFLKLENYIWLHRLLQTPTDEAISNVRRRSFRYPISASSGVMEVRETSLANETVTEGTILGEEKLLQDLELYIAAKGFHYPTALVRSYYISLKTRPFALLTGATGIGKSRLTSLFAEALTGATTHQYLLLPVRPDWADSTHLLGFMNLLADCGEGRYLSTPFLDFVLRANQPEHSERLFFVCLDEMNLARVEHYFAEVLSAMESPDRLLRLQGGFLTYLPDNLFLTGTLNLDEATLSITRKTLDRANVLPFGQVNLQAEVIEQTSHSFSMSASSRQRLFLNSRMKTPAQARQHLQKVSQNGQDFADWIIERLQEANGILEPHGLGFAYRVRDDALRFCANSFSNNGKGLFYAEDCGRNLKIAFDRHTIQRIVPRLSGSRDLLEDSLLSLKAWAESHQLEQTQERLERMVVRLNRDGYISFDVA